MHSQNDLFAVGTSIGEFYYTIAINENSEFKITDEDALNDALNNFKEGKPPLKLIWAKDVQCFSRDTTAHILEMIEKNKDLVELPKELSDTLEEAKKTKDTILLRLNWNKVRDVEEELTL